VQEFMIIPAHAPSFKEGLRYAAETYHALKGILERKYGKGAINVGDEGGFAPPMKETREALDALVSAINEAGYSKEMRIGMDCAASSFYADGKYAIDGKSLSGGELIDHLGGLLSSYPVVSVEDPLQEDDFEGFAEFTRKHGGKMQVVGDDLLCTNTARIKTAIRKKACNALLLKINQIGTVTEAINAAKLAKKAGWNVVVSHRSGETEDNFIADFAVGIDARQIKTGAPARGERTSKYNQLLRIEEKVGNTYAKVFQ
jgi:enolase